MWAKAARVDQLSERWDAEFYSTQFTDIQRALEKFGSRDLGHFVRSATRGAAPDYPGTGIRVINSVNVRSIEFSDERISFASPEYVSRFPSALVEKGDLVVTSTGIGTLGRVFCNLHDAPWFADGHICVLKLHNPADAPYLCAFLQSPLGQLQFIQRRRGSSRQVEIYPEDILTVQVPALDPELARNLGLQWMSAVERVAGTRNCYAEAEQLVLEAVGWRKLASQTYPNTYQITSLAVQESGRLDAEFFSPRYSELMRTLKAVPHLSFAECVRSYAKGCQPKSYDPTGEITVVKSKDVNKSGINVGNCDRCRTSDLEKDVTWLEQGDVLVNMTGVGTLGRAAVLRSQTAQVTAAVDVSVWKVRTDLIVPEYLALFLNCPLGALQSVRWQTGSSGQLHLYPDQLRQYLIFVPTNRNGSPDIRFQKRVAELVSRSSSERARCHDQIDALRRTFAQLIGIDPKVVRE